MNTEHDAPPFAGSSFEVSYDGLTAINAYAPDGKQMSYEITEGPYAGAKGTVQYAWQQVGSDVYAITWQETDRSTVVHIDDFKSGTSLSFFTTAQLEFHRLKGGLRKLSP